MKHSLWTLRLDDLIEVACRSAGRNLSYTEWDQYFRGEEYRLPCIDLSIHPSVLATARDIAKSGDIEGATSIFQRAVELDSSLEFDPKTEAQKWRAKGLREQGNKLAKEGNIKEAIAAYEEAKALDPSLDVDPKTEAQKWRAKGLREQGNKLAKKGKVEEAIATYEEAKALDPSLEFDPQTEAHKWAAQGLIAQGEQLAQEGKIEEAIAAYEEAQSLDPNIKISAYSWNILCWNGSLGGYAAEVMNACEQAVAPDPTHGNRRDSRGLARALTGDIDGAIEDFQIFVDWTDDEEEKAQRQRWIEALQAGENPFTPEVLEELRQ